MVRVADVVEDGEEEEEGVQDDVEDRFFEGWVVVLNVHQLTLYNSSYPRYQFGLNIFQRKKGTKFMD